jgi:hypothetical protein
VRPDFRSPAETTEGLLQAGIHRGVPVPIPGALEPHVDRPAVELATIAEVSLTPHTTPNFESRRQAEYEREGGGAPSERRAGADRSFGARLRDWLRRAS